MIPVSQRVQDLLERSVRYDVFSRVVLDIELNGYSDFFSESSAAQIEFPESVEPNMFPEKSVFRVRRPHGGLPRSISGDTLASDLSFDGLNVIKSSDPSSENFSSNIWWRVPSSESSYKYFRSKKLAEQSAGGNDWNFDEPIEFSVIYPNPILANRLVIGFEYSNALPIEVSVEVMHDESWNSIGVYEPQENGVIDLYYDGTWGEGSEGSYSFSSISGIRFYVNTMRRRHGNTPPAIELIQISPRITLDITDRIISTDISKESEASSIVAPVGISSANSCSISIANDDRFFDPSNQESPIAGLVDVNIKFTISDLVGDDDAPLEEVPQGVFYANSWNFDSQGTVMVDALDYSKFLQSRTMENSFYNQRDVRFVVADILERSGVVDYAIFYTQEDSESKTPYYYFDDDITVWEALQSISTAEQAIFLFDENGRFVWFSRDYWWQSDDVGYEILSREKDGKLANLQDYTAEYTRVVNKATVQYYPTDILKRGDDFINNFLWEQDEDTVLVASPLLNEINDDSSYIIVSDQDFPFFEEEGIVNIDAEHIRYSKKLKTIPGANPATQQTIEDLIQRIKVAINIVSDYAEVQEEEVDIIHAEKVLWPNSLLGRIVQTPIIFNTNPVKGFFVILRADGEFYQLNSSFTQRPFIAAIAGSSEDDPDFSYWNIIDDELVFTDNGVGYTPRNALFIEKRGEFNSKKENHSFSPHPGSFRKTFRGKPAGVVNLPALASDFVEASKLKIRTNTIDPTLIHHYYPNAPSSISGRSFSIYGAELVFPAEFSFDTGLSYNAEGIAGIFINQGDPGTGYYIEVVTTEYSLLSEDNKREVRVWKYINDEITLIAGFFPEDESILTIPENELQEIAGAAATVSPDVPQTLTVFTENKQYLITQSEFDGEDPEEESPSILVDGIRISVYLNGNRIFAVVDKQTSVNNIYTEGHWGVYSRSHTAVDFEYIYAIDRLGDTVLLDKSEHAIRDQINGGYISNILEKYLSQYSQLRNDFVFDDFGAWVREAKEFDVKYEVSPAISASLFSSNESRIYPIYINLDQFAGKFALGNRTRRFVVLSGDDPVERTSMSLAIYGVPINQSLMEEVKKLDDQSAWRRGEEEIIVDSAWIQTKEKAERIADWIIDRWSSPSESISVNVAIDPRVQIGDIATIAIPEDFVSENDRFHVVSVQKAVSEQKSMTLVLRKANF